jgi:hypothetical protein
MVGEAHPTLQPIIVPESWLKGLAAGDVSLLPGTQKLELALAMG